MQFAISEGLAQRFIYTDETGSTNTDLVAAASAGSAADWPDFSVMVTGNQTAGRGRSGRDWVAPAGSSLFVSVLLRPSDVGIDKLSWIPLLSGLAMASAVASFAESSDVRIKWPNDVLIGEQKIAGVLSELLPDLSGVVVGAGLNVYQTQAEQPVDNATSMAIQNAAPNSLDLILAKYLQSLRKHYESFVLAKGDAVASGLQAAVTRNCSTIGREVRVMLPGGEDLFGKAIEIDATGRIVIENSAGEKVAVAAGDIVHLRHNIA